MIVPFFISHRGCPHRCVFCDQETISGAPDALPTADEIVSAVARFRDTSAGRPLEVAFFGGTFTSLSREDQELLLDPIQPMLKSGEIVSIRLSTRPDALCGETVEFLRGRGVKTVELGVQSLDDDVLAAACRGHSADDVKAACRSVRAGGLDLGIQLMPGLPFSSRQSDLDSLFGSIALGPDFLRIYPSLVLRGTTLEQMFRSGGYKPLSLESAVALCADMLLAAHKAGVPVRRLGLQSSTSLEAEGAVVAGPYHPAFRQLVESELFFRLLLLLASGLPSGTHVQLSSSPSRLSDVIGQQRRNAMRLASEAGVIIDRVMGDTELSNSELIVHTTGGVLQGDLLRDLAIADEGNYHDR